MDKYSHLPEFMEIKYQIMILKYNLQSGDEEKRIKKMIDLQEKILKLNQDSNGDTHRDTMRAFFRATMLRLKFKEICGKDEF